jgi:hypothetical protein
MRDGDYRVIRCALDKDIIKALGYIWKSYQIDRLAGLIYAIYTQKDYGKYNTLSQIRAASNNYGPST